MSEPADKNGKKDLLHTLLSDSDRTIKLITLALIVISGGGNLFATKGVERSNTYEWDRALTEIHELHAELTASIGRQKKMIEYIEKEKTSVESMDQALKELQQLHGQITTALSRQQDIVDYIREQKNKNP